jgi:hypothetical protein
MRVRFGAAIWVLGARALGAFVTRDAWLRLGAGSLVCEAGDAAEVPSDAILVEHVNDS